MTVTIRLRAVAVPTAAFVVGAALALVMALALTSRDADAAPGDDDTTFVPVDPCRLFDFRSGNPPAGGRKEPLGPGQIHAQQVTGDVGECQIPGTATGVAMNVTAVGGTTNSHLRIYPGHLTTVPTVSSLNWRTPVATPNKVDVRLSPAGTIKLYNAAGRVNVLADVVGYYVDTSLTQLHQRVAALGSKLAPVSVETVDGQPTVRFSGVNVQIVDGSGSTADISGPTGRGNLIVGYHHNQGDTRTGSHNLVIGDRHTYTSYGGLVAGLDNATTGPNATVSGGFQNTAGGQLSAVHGGQQNLTSDYGTAIAGGRNNEAAATFATVGGGRDNVAFGIDAAVAGGIGNLAAGGGSAVTGGLDNNASGTGSVVSGGREGVAVGNYTAIAGGFSSNASGQYSSVAGGNNNTADGSYSTVAGGSNNQVTGSYDSIAGGTSVTCNRNPSGVCGEGEID